MRSLRRTAALALAAATVLTGAAALTVGPAAAATARTRDGALNSAHSYGVDHGYKNGIAVYDTKTGYLEGRNAYATFASESVVKTMIATRILLQGRMHGDTATRAYKMITQSDDAIASAFYGSVGGDSLIDYIKSHYDIPRLGSRPPRSGWWGSTKITAAGLVTFYAKIKADKKVGPWLINAMHHATTHGSDGFYQFFGLKQANKDAAIKQGWGFDYYAESGTASENSTGFVGPDNRYAVAILARGPGSSYGSRIGDAISTMARTLLPYGSFPDPTPAITGVSALHGFTSGGQYVYLHGHDFTHLTSVVFGGVKGTGVHTISPTLVRVITPAHRTQKVSIYLVTTHGTATSPTQFQFGPGPAVHGLSVHSGPTRGGTRFTVTGNYLGGVQAIYFGNTPGANVHTVNSHAIQVTSPKHSAGTANVYVRTVYGTSRYAGSAGAFRYTG